ncbi:hypothetical protein NDI76_15740 [Halogeometricum sp. S1BR25-6]|uniref:Uncharacterized protein n=1 Tax=Halogeometricum salsisoli TaxID=2950536 RepID=A0ABU2GIV4_9EURY|nr:hypothetical protein [Halogeometricum sp. S1BR25-6]MDS0300199.1 hypothetical protein [Halogeometricum sp. S1BR25-6]
MVTKANAEQYGGTISVRGVVVSVGYTLWLLVTSALQSVRERLRSE